MLGPDEELRQTPSRLPSSSSSDPPPTYRFPTEFFYRRIYSCFVRRVLAFWFSTGGADLSFSIFPGFCPSVSSPHLPGQVNGPNPNSTRRITVIFSVLQPHRLDFRPFLAPASGIFFQGHPSELCRRLVSLPVDLCRSESESEYDCNMTSRRHLISPQHGRPVCLGWHSPHILRS
jgi:hypothetical protein